MATATDNIHSPFVYDTSDQEFETAVLERSRDVVVVVDFWAPWCGPCRVLGPLLERLVAEMDGAFVLAKVNVDENPELSRRFDVRGIPFVKAFHNGQVVDTFTGALPEREVRAWLRKQIPSNADQLVAEAEQTIATDPAAAIERFRAALAEDPSHPGASLGLGRLLVLAGDPEGATILRHVPAGTPAYPMAHELLALNDFLTTAVSDLPTPPPAPTSAEARYAAAVSFGQGGQWAEALEQLLGVIRTGRNAGPDTFDHARRAMLAIFSLLGDADPLVPRYRRLLANALF